MFGNPDLHSNPKVSSMYFEHSCVFSNVVYKVRLRLGFLPIGCDWLLYALDGCISFAENGMGPEVHLLCVLAIISSIHRHANLWFSTSAPNPAFATPMFAITSITGARGPKRRSPGQIFEWTCRLVKIKLATNCVIIVGRVWSTHACRETTGNACQL